MHYEPAHRPQPVHARLRGHGGERIGRRLQPDDGRARQEAEDRDRHAARAESPGDHGPAGEAGGARAAGLGELEVGSQGDRRPEDGQRVLHGRGQDGDLHRDVGAAARDRRRGRAGDGPRDRACARRPHARAHVDRHDHRAGDDRRRRRGRRARRCGSRRGPRARRRAARIGARDPAAQQPPGRIRGRPDRHRARGARRLRPEGGGDAVPEDGQAGQRAAVGPVDPSLAGEPRRVARRARQAGDAALPGGQVRRRYAAAGKADHLPGAVMLPPRRRVVAAWGLALLLLSGCAAVRNYDAELYFTLEQASSGNVEAAIGLLEANNRAADKDLLYYLELGMLQRLGGRYGESQKAWTSANERIQARASFTDIARLAAAAPSFMISDKLRPYQAYDYEQVMLLTYMALNHLAMGDYDNARVAIKQTHEREAEIAETRARQLAEVEEQAKSRGARSSVKELNGYPVETIDNPTVNALRNSYQSALSHYLAGFVYEALGEPSLAAPGYRLANELQPGQPLLEEALRGFDQRVAAPDDGMTDVLFILSTGAAPRLSSQKFLMPAWIGTSTVLVSLSFPVIEPAHSARPPARIVAGSETILAAPITSIDLMARRRLKDDMPGIMLRAAIRSATSATLQVQAQRAAGDRNAAPFALAAAIVGAGTALLDSADDRTWRALPSEVSIARARLPRGANVVTVDTLDGPRSVQVAVSGRYAVVDLRLLRHQLFVNAPRVLTRSVEGGQDDP